MIGMQIYNVAEVSGMNADIVTKSIIFNRKLNKFLLLKRGKEETGITDISIERVAYVTLVNGKKLYLIIADFERNKIFEYLEVR